MKVKMGKRLMENLKIGHTSPFLEILASSIKKLASSNFRFQILDFRLNKIRCLVFAINNIKDSSGHSIAHRTPSKQKSPYAKE
jgi:hypothetical protein